MFLIPGFVNAEGIQNYYIDVTVLENGDLSVKELFNLEGDYRGFERKIDYANLSSQEFIPEKSNYGGSSIHNGTGIKLISIKGMNQNISWDTFKEKGDLFQLVSNASAGSYGKYTERKTSNGSIYRIYNPSSKKKSFYLEYKLENMAVLHNDIGEIGWTVFGSELTEDIDHLEVRVHVPQNKELLRAWAHGPLRGEIKLVDEKTATFTIDSLDAQTAIDIRLAFDKEAIKNSTKTTNVDALEKIISYETIKAEEANQEREQLRKEYESQAIYLVERVEKTKTRYDYEEAEYAVNHLYEGNVKQELLRRLDIVYSKVLNKENQTKLIYTCLLTAWLVGLMFVLHRIYSKYDKEYESTFKGKYYRDFPKEYGPEIVGYLIHQNINNNDLSAAIANLICKKIITCEQVGKDYQLTYQGDFGDKTELEKLSYADRELIQFLFDDYKVNQITLSQLKQRAKKRYQRFLERYTDWKNVAVQEAKAYNFYETSYSAKTLGSIYAIFGLFLAILAISTNLLKVYPAICMVLAIISFIYFLAYIKRSKEGNEDYTRWLGLKNFMEDFGRMDEKDLPELVLWEKYLVYAITLGCADKLAKTMQIKVQELEANGYTVSDAVFDYHTFRMMTNFNQMIQQTVTSSMQSAHSAANASSSNSSGGGFGGGFSSGGGSFGGGGGGGRF